MKRFQVAKKQHFVSQGYLRSWAKDEKIWFSINRENISIAALKNVGEQNYFYKFNPNISDIEIRYAEALFKDNNPNIQKLYDYWINLYKSLSLSIKTISLISQRLEKCEELSKQFEEMINCKLENCFYPFLHKLQEGDKSFFDNDDDKIDFLLGFMEICLRTKNMKNRIINSIKDECIKCGINHENLWMLTRHQWAILISRMLYVKNYKIKILEDDSNSLITGDQPVINSKPEIIDGEITNLEYYCPLTPSKALLLTQGDSSNEKLTIENRDFYNKLIRDESQMQLYADSKNTLDYVIKL